MPPSPEVIYWSDQCSAARNVPLSVLLTRVAASSFIALSMFAITAAFSLLVLISWLRLPQHDRRKLWKHIGSFSCLLVVSCCVGVPMFVASYMYEFLPVLPLQPLRNFPRHIHCYDFSLPVQLSNRI